MFVEWGIFLMLVELYTQENCKEFGVVNRECMMRMSDCILDEGPDGGFYFCAKERVERFNSGEK